MGVIGRYLAMDIGCIECGESSDVIGTFTTEAAAEEACAAAAAVQARDWHGQHSFEVFDLAPDDPGP